MLKFLLIHFTWGLGCCAQPLSSSCRVQLEDVSWKFSQSLSYLLQVIIFDSRTRSKQTFGSDHCKPPRIVPMFKLSTQNFREQIIEKKGGEEVASRSPRVS